MSKIKLDWWQLYSFLVELFMLTFVMVYLGKVGLDNFVIFAGDDTWKLLFNLSLFYMMTMFFVNGTFKSLKKFLNKEETKNEKT